MTSTACRGGAALMLLALPGLLSATVTFERRWHWNREDVGRSVVQTVDDGYLVSGQTWIGSSQYSIVLARTDSLGDTTSVQHLPGASNGSGYLCRLSGGGFVTAGVRNGPYLFARGFDDAGDSLWSYDSTRRGAVLALIATSDGGCLIAGRDSAQDMALIRLDSAGQEQWIHSYDEPYVQGSTARGVAETGDGGFILCGDATDYMGSYIRLVRTNSAGDTVWTRLFSGPVGPSLRAVRETQDGGFLAIGSEFDTLGNRDALYLMRTDSSGSVVWTRNVPMPGAGTMGLAMNTTQDGGFVVAGQIDWTDSARAWLVKLDSAADTIWTAVLPGSGRERAVDVRQTADGGYVLAGTSDPPNDSILLAKTDSVGYLMTGVAEDVLTEGHRRIDLSVTPNPTTGIARVSYSAPGAAGVTLQLCDVTGRQVHLSYGLRTSPLQLDLRAISEGVYLLRLESAGRSATRKLVIE